MTKTKEKKVDHALLNDSTVAAFDFAATDAYAIKQ